MDRYEIKGRTGSGLAIFGAYSVLMWFVIIIFLFLTLNEPFDILLILADLFFLGFSILLSYQVVQNLRIKTVTLDENGICYKIGKKTKWSFKWIEIQTLMSDSFSGKAPRIGFTLKVRDKWHSVNNRDDLGNKDQLKKAFRFGVERALPLGVKIVDSNGWAQDIFTEDTLELSIQYYQKYKGQWNVSSKPAELSKQILLYFGGGLLLISFVLFIIGYFFDDLNFLAWTILILGILFSCALYYNLLVTITEIWFDDEGVKMKFFTSKVIQLSWSEVVNVITINKTGLIGVAGKNRSGWNGGGFPEDVCEAVKYIYALEKKKDKK